jgi:Nucleotidyl transferase AbiEii toxin, Type IV TA system
MFERLHHQRIAKVLHAFNNDALTQAQCYFAGGTAIALSLAEYRESRDVDFLCASKEGYRFLRNAISQNSLGLLLKAPLKLRREVRADMYGIRTVVEVDGEAIKVEFISEGRIDLTGNFDPFFGVPTLSREDMYAEKLLANADRGLDKAHTSRDIIDLAMMIEQWGAIPDQAWSKVKLAYGDHVVKAFQKSANLICDRDYLKHCLRTMHMEEELLDRIPAILGCTPRNLDADRSDNYGVEP